MKYLCFILFWTSLFACASKQPALDTTKSNNHTFDCPEDGNCTFKILKNKNLNIKKDDIGLAYPDIIDGENIVLIFEYKRNELSDTEDSSYSELIYLEIKPNELDVDYTDSNMQKTKLTFGRLCFCRGQTGYYKVHSGQLQIKKRGKDNYHLKLQFQIDEVPQVITSIDEDFTL